MKNVDKPILRRYHCPMGTKGMALIEIVVGMIILGVLSLVISATITLVNSKQNRSAVFFGSLGGGVLVGGSSLELQALNHARDQLELLKNNVSPLTAAGEKGARLLQSGSPYDTTSAMPLQFTQLPVSGTRNYVVSDISGTTLNTSGTDLKRVTVTVTWTD